MELQPVLAHGKKVGGKMKRKKIYSVSRAPYTIRYKHSRIKMRKRLKKTGSKPSAKSKLRLFFLNFGKIILDLTKLCFGSLVLGTIIKGNFSQSALLNLGIIISGAGAVIGIIFLSLLEDK